MYWQRASCHGINSLCFALGPHFAGQAQAHAEMAADQVCAPQGGGLDDGELRAQLAEALCALAEMHLAQVRSSLSAFPLEFVVGLGDVQHGSGGQI